MEEDDGVAIACMCRWLPFLRLSYFCMTAPSGQHRTCWGVTRGVTAAHGEEGCVGVNVLSYPSLRNCMLFNTTEWVCFVRMINA